MLCVGDGLGDGLVAVVMFCRGDSFEEDLRCWAKLGVFVDLLELDDEVDDVGVILLRTVEALRGGFFFSTSVLNTKGAGEVGASREMMDSNTSLPSMVTPKHFLAVSAICLDRSDLACTCISGSFLYKAVVERFVLPRL